jgi:hypothetical protein
VKVKELIKISKNNLKYIKIFIYKEILSKYIIMDMETILKVCRVCNEAKPEHCYYVASRRCRACVSKINTGKNKDYMKEYYKSKNII